MCANTTWRLSAAGERGGLAADEDQGSDSVSSPIASPIRPLAGAAAVDRL